MATINQSKLPKRYISVSAMLIESAALSAVTGIVLIVTLHTNVASSIGVEALYGVVTVCVNVNSQNESHPHEGFVTNPYRLSSLCR